MGRNPASFILRKGLGAFLLKAEGIVEQARMVYRKEGSCKKQADQGR
jgi:hypothetical protein